MNEQQIEQLFEEMIFTRGIYKILGFDKRSQVNTIRINYRNGRVSFEKKLELLRMAGYSVEINIS
jgi:RecB family endonuclease NucS